MKHLLWALLVVAGCSSSADSPAERAAEFSPLVAFDAQGRWGVGTPAVEHWLYDPDDKKEHDPSNGGAKATFFRDTLPFPQYQWGTGDFEVTQLVFPAGEGLMARYHVMNHGSEPRAVRLIVGRRERGGLPELVAGTTPSEKSASRLAFDLKIEPGASQFVIVTTPGAAGRDPVEALDQAAADWEKKLARPITISDPEALSEYCQNLAGRALGMKERDLAARKFEDRFVRKEGDALRLLADVPEPWLLETIEVKGLRTDFGPLGFRHIGFYNSRTLDLDPGCSPPGGFLLAVDAKHTAKVDGRPAQAKDGTLRLPAGTRRVELARNF